MKHILLVMSLSVLMQGCGDSGGNGGLGLMSSTVQNVSAQIGNVGDMLSDSKSLPLVLEREDNVPAPTLATHWTTAGGVMGLYDGTAITLKEWMGNQFNDSYENSNGARVTFAGRIRNTLMIFCYLGQMGFTTDADNLPSVGSYTKTLTPSMMATCEGGSAGNNPSETVAVTVSTTSDTTLYDKYIEVGLGGSACPFKIYARLSATNVNIATSEDQSCEGRTQGSRGIVLYDVTAQKIRFHYISQAFGGYPTGFEMYRGYYDVAADQAWLFGINASDSIGGIDHSVAFTAAGKPADASATIALSVDIFSQNAVPDGVYKACVSNSGTIGTDDSLACTLTGTELTGGVFADIVTEERALSPNLAAFYNIGETTSVNFTNQTDIFQ